jgi:hypothetical protein
MRRVYLHRNAFINDRYCDAGSVVDIDDHVALASFMKELPASVIAPAVPVTHAAMEAPPQKTVTVHVHPGCGEVDIDAAGVEMHIDHATLKVEVD